MENFRPIKLSKYIILGGMLLAIPFFVLSYDDRTTHPALTQEIIKFFNKNYPELKLNDEEAKLIIQGSVDEDSGVRYLHHFYDPIYNRGLVMENEDLKNPELALIIGGAKSKWQSSKEWAGNSKLQSGILGFASGIMGDYFSSKSDYSWDRAIYDYSWGDRKRGLESLGHILHLLEDMSVPDHTRYAMQKTVGSHLQSYFQWI